MSLYASGAIPVVAPFLISQCYNTALSEAINANVVAPFLISQCYNKEASRRFHSLVVAPFLISQCYNLAFIMLLSQ